MAKKNDKKQKPVSKENIEHIHLPECKSCWALREDFYDGILADRANNPQRVYLACPLEYMRKIEDELQKKQQIKGAKPYKVSIKINTKDNRVFESAEFRYGKRLLRYTTESKSTLPRVRTKEQSVYCVKEVNTTRRIKTTTDLSARKYAQQMVPLWEKAGYKGKCRFFNIDGKQLLSAHYEMKDIATDKNKKDKTTKESISEFNLTSQATQDGKIQIQVTQNMTTTERISEKMTPKDWAATMHQQALKEGLSGHLETNINSYGKLVISGKYTRTKYTNQGSTHTEVIFYNSENSIPDKPKLIPVDTESFRPTKPSGKGMIEVRSIAQDDEYTPLQRRSRTAENSKIQHESELYNEQKRLSDDARMLRQQANAIKQQASRKIDSAGHSIGYTRELELWDQAKQLERRADAIEQILKHQ